MGWSAIAVIAVAFGCGDGGGAPATDAAVTDEFGCNPVSNAGCEDDLRCAYVLASEAPVTGTLDCVATGATPLDAPCTRGAVGIDDCGASAWCDLSSGTCLQLCLRGDPAFPCLQGTCTSFASGEFDAELIPTVGACR